MKIYLLVSPSHSQLLQEWFLPSLNDQLPVEIRYIPQLCDGSYKSAGWTSAMLEKVALIESAIADNFGGEFVYSDVDVQFFGSIVEVLKNLSCEIDLFFQKDSPSGMLCAGFFLCRANERTASFWRHVRETLRRSPGSGDQDIVNRLLRPQEKGMASIWRWFASPLEAMTSFGYLPDSFFGAGTFTGKLWNPGDAVPMPVCPLVHHANWTVGTPNKIAQLMWVRKQLSSSAARSSIAQADVPVRQLVGVLPGKNSTEPTNFSS